MEDQIKHLSRVLDKPVAEIRRAMANLEARGLIERVRVKS